MSLWVIFGRFSGFCLPARFCFAPKTDLKAGAGNGRHVGHVEVHHGPVIQALEPGA
jgi:hypothetical protein